MTSPLQNIQTTPPHESYIIRPGMSSTDITEPIAIDDMLIKKRNRSISYCLPDDPPFEVMDSICGFDIYGYRDGYIRLGLLMFELLFSAQHYIEIQITQSKSDCQQLYIHLDRNNQPSLAPYLRLKTHESFESYEYHIRTLERYPYLATHEEDDALPTFRYSYSGGDAYGIDFMKKADQIIVTTTVSGLVHMAALLLDIGNEHNEQGEIVLENPLYGVGGVSQLSLEVRFWLPGSFGFYTNSLEDLKFEDRS